MNYNQTIDKSDRRNTTCYDLNIVSLFSCAQDPFYVRCIKPNELKSPIVFNDDRVGHQVRRIRRMMWVVEGREKGI